MKVPDNLLAKILPSTANPLSPISQDSTLAFAVSYSNAPEMLSTLQEIPHGYQQTSVQSLTAEEMTGETKRWIMKAAGGDGNHSRNGIRRWAISAWTEFVDLLKVSRLCRWRSAQFRC